MSAMRWTGCGRTGSRGPARSPPPARPPPSEPHVPGRLTARRPAGSRRRTCGILDVQMVAVGRRAHGKSIPGAESTRPHAIGDLRSARPRSMRQRGDKHTGPVVQNVNLRALSAFRPGIIPDRAGWPHTLGGGWIRPGHYAHFAKDSIFGERRRSTELQAASARYCCATPRPEPSGLGTMAR